MTQPIEAELQIRAALLAWREDGVANPTIPVYKDEDGDGVADFYGLDDNDNLVLVSGITIADTVAESTGEGIETGFEGTENG